jgi:Zn-dependent M16 (insulinase) family peptidase
MRQEYRQKILDLTKEELRLAVSDHLSSKKNDGVVVCFGNKELIEKENQTLALHNKTLPITPI